MKRRRQRRLEQQPQLFEDLVDEPPQDHHDDELDRDIRRMTLATSSGVYARRRAEF